MEENQNEFIGLGAIKLYHHKQAWILEDDGQKYSYTTSGSGSLPIGSHFWSNPNSWSFIIEIKELQCGKNQGYMIKHLEDFPTRSASFATNTENCFRQVLKL